MKFKPQKAFERLRDPSENSQKGEENEPWIRGNWKISRPEDSNTTIRRSDQNSSADSFVVLMSVWPDSRTTDCNRTLSFPGNACLCCQTWKCMSVPRASKERRLAKLLWQCSASDETKTQPERGRKSLPTKTHAHTHTHTDTLTHAGTHSLKRMRRAKRASQANEWETRQWNERTANKKKQSQMLAYSMRVSWNFISTTHWNILYSQLNYKYILIELYYLLFTILYQIYLRVFNAK